MFYTTKEGHPFRHNSLSAIVTPRPIAWISTRYSDGQDNLAPYSFSNLTAYKPPQVMFASTLSKPDRERSMDTVSNIEASGVFCIDVTEHAARAAVNASSAPLDRSADEFAHTGVEKRHCETISCARVADAPASLECRLNKVINILGEDNHLVLRFVEAMDIRKDCIVDNRFEVTTYQPLTRLGYQDYAAITSKFQLAAPNSETAFERGLL